MNRKIVSINTNIAKIIEKIIILKIKIGNANIVGIQNVCK